MRARRPEVDLLLFDEPVRLPIIPRTACASFLRAAFFFWSFLPLFSYNGCQTSSLDAHAQNDIFDTIEAISRSPSGERSKTVIWITHRLSTARRADKIAMVENGVSLSKKFP
jgi:ABC-type uncharacterized transport system ATPase subunit